MLNEFIEVVLRYRRRSAAVAVVTAAMAVGLIIQGSGSTPEAGPSAPVASPQSPALANPEVPESTAPAPEATVSPEAAAETAKGGATIMASAFTRTWLAGRTLPRGAWLDSLKGSARADLVAALETTDPVDIPEAEIKAEPELISVLGATATYDIRLTNGAAVTVILAYSSPEGWRAINILPVGDL